MIKADFVFHPHGSLWLVQPTSDQAREQLVANVSDEAQWWAGRLVVEPRYVASLAEQLTDEGWTVTL